MTETKYQGLSVLGLCVFNFFHGSCKVYNPSHFTDEEMVLEMLTCPRYSISKSLSWAMTLVLIDSKVYFNLLPLIYNACCFLCIYTSYTYMQ